MSFVSLLGSQRATTSIFKNTNSRSVGVVLAAPMLLVSVGLSGANSPKKEIGLDTFARANVVDMKHGHADSNPQVLKIASVPASASPKTEEETIIADLVKKYDQKKFNNGQRQRVSERDIKYVVKKTIGKTGYGREDVLKIIAHEGFMKFSYDRTIGIGHKLSPKEIKRYKKGVNNDAIVKLLAEDINHAKEVLKSILGDEIEKNLTPGQRYALTDLCFNAGESRLRKSDLIEYIKKGEFKKAIAEFNFGGTIKDGTIKVTPGLCLRDIERITVFVKDLSKEEKTIAIKVMEELMKKGQSAIKNANALAEFTRRAIAAIEKTRVSIGK